MTTTASRPKKHTKASQFSDVERLKSELDDAKAELALVNRFLEKIQTFSCVVGSAKTELKRLKAEERTLSDSLQELRSNIRDVTALIDSSNNGMLSLIEPGPAEFMPLFDQMEKSDPAKHGTNARKWREQPLSLLRLSPTSTALLYEAEILFIGQLQDRILEDPEEWWLNVEGLTLPIAAAIADKLADFVAKGGDV